MHIPRRMRRGFTFPELMISMVISAMIFIVTIFAMTTSMRVWQRASSLNQAYPPAYQILSHINADLLNSAYVLLPPLWTSGTSYAVGSQVVCLFTVADPNDSLGRTLNVYQTFTCLVANTASSSNTPVQNTASADWAPAPSWIIIYAPLMSGSYPALPFDESDNNVVAFYISDTTGKVGNTGTNLWRMTFNQNSNNTVTVLTRTNLAANVSSLSFYSATASGNQILSVDSIAVSLLGTQNSKTVEGDTSGTKTTSTFSCGIAFRNPSVATAPSLPLNPDTSTTIW